MNTTRWTLADTTLTDLSDTQMLARSVRHAVQPSKYVDGTVTPIGKSSARPARQRLHHDVSGVVAGITRSPSAAPATVKKRSDHVVSGLIGFRRDGCRWNERVGGDR